MHEQHATCSRTLILIFCLVLAVRVTAVQPGDDEVAVRAELGPPVGQYKLGERTIMSFERGEVEFVDGKVTRSELISVEEAAQRKARREREAAEAAERARIAKEKRIVEGQEIYQRKISDPAFMNSSATERFTFWNGFKTKYPEVPLGPEYDQARSEYNLEQQARRAAAQEAAQAQARAATAQSGSYSTSSGVYYNDSYYRNGGAIVVDPGYGHGHRPPMVVNPGASVTPFESTAGYGFQRALNTPSSSGPAPRPPTHRPRPPTRPTPRPAR